jgi:hypothetical protein
MGKANKNEDIASGPQLIVINTPETSPVQTVFIEPLITVKKTTVDVVNTMKDALPTIPAVTTFQPPAPTTRLALF